MDIYNIFKLDINHIINGMMASINQHPERWLIMLGLSIINLILMEVYILTHHKKYLFWVFALIIISIYLLLYFVYFEVK